MYHCSISAKTRRKDTTVCPGNRKQSEEKKREGSERRRKGREEERAKEEPETGVTPAKVRWQTIASEYAAAGSASHINVASDQCV